MLRSIRTTLVLMMALCHATVGQLNLATFQSEALIQHNFRRGQYGTPNVALDAALNTMAQSHASNMSRLNAFSFITASGIGQNIWKISSSGVIGYVNGSQPVETFFAGSASYNYAAPAASQFTQLIWRASTTIGVGISLTSDSKAAYVSVLYSPGGNYNGQFPANVPQPLGGATTAAPATTVVTAVPTVPTTTVAPTAALLTFQSESLARHNFLRAKHCTANLILNATLNTIAQNYAKYLADNNIFNHSRVAGLGENLWYMSSSAAIGYVNGSTPTQAWYDEIGVYNYSAPGFAAATGHFTQVVWTDSTQLGVGLAFNADRTKAYAVANYVTPGNYLGQFDTRVKKPLC